VLGWGGCVGGRLQGAEGVESRRRHTGRGAELATLCISPGGSGVCLYMSELLLLFLVDYAFFSISTTALLIDENRNLML
jgi:hypothetical protein